MPLIPPPSKYVNAALLYTAAAAKTSNVQLATGQDEYYFGRGCLCESTKEEPDWALISNHKFDYYTKLHENLLPGETKVDKKQV